MNIKNFIENSTELRLKYRLPSAQGKQFIKFIHNPISGYHQQTYKNIITRHHLRLNNYVGEQRKYIILQFNTK